MSPRMRSLVLAAVLLCWAGAAAAQALPKPPGALTEAEVRNLLVWNSPWEGRASPPQSYSFRTVFRARREGLIAETVSYATSQRADSVVRIDGPRVTWQDSNGAEVNVAVAESGDLVGSATSSAADLKIVFKPRP